MIPEVEDLRSSPLVHKFGDVFNPPGLTNFLGCVQVDRDLTGIRSLNFPPFACSDTITAGLYVDGKYFPSTGCPITYTWYPDRIEREAEYLGIKFRTTTVLAVNKMAAIVLLMVENRSGIERSVELCLGLRGGVTREVSSWNRPLPPTEGDNIVEVDEKRKALLFTAHHSRACLLQGAFPLAGEATPHDLKFHVTLKAGKPWKLSYVNVVGENASEVQEIYDALIMKVEKEIHQARDQWNQELQAVFTSGNARYSGFLPTLETIDRDILKLYHMGILGVIYFKRDNPHSVYGRAYDTLMPRYWQTVTFLWDYSLSSLLHALLDPEVMQKNLEHWMRLDIHQHFGTEYLTGGPVGAWYSANDYAMIGIAWDYLRWNGNHTWLKKRIESQSYEKKQDHRVVDYLLQYASNWKKFKSKYGLADYGGIFNLLECVSSYIHEVASLNAANVFNMRTAAEILSLLGEAKKSTLLLEEAANLAKEIQKLYVNGQGYWNTRLPDGRLVQVRHCYDFLTILNTIPEDLTPKQKIEMVQFFKRELQTPTWMHALSCGDNDVLYSVRPDHQWTGAYPAWPPQAVRGLYRIGQVELAFEWLKGLARTANQGPFAQAHFVESVMAPEHGGARKAPPDMPYITDWLCSSNGSWIDVIIESIFGVQATLNGGISATPQFGAFDSKAELRNLSYQGKMYHVTRSGIKSAD